MLSEKSYTRHLPAFYPSNLFSLSLQNTCNNMKFPQRLFLTLFIFSTVFSIDDISGQPLLNLIIYEAYRNGRCCRCIELSTTLLCVCV